MKFRIQEVIGWMFVGAVMSAAVLAVWWTPHDPMALNLRAKLQPPSAAFWLGTDEFGRDVMSRIMAGASSSVLVAVCTVILATSLGVAVGLTAGFLRCWPFPGFCWRWD